jgi:cytochrome b561
LPKFTAGWIRTVVLHTLLYIFMWAVPITGIFLSNSYQPNNVHLFGLIIPDLFPQNSALIAFGRNLHFWFAYIFLAFTVLHLGAQWKVVRAHWRQVQKWLERQHSRWFS